MQKRTAAPPGSSAIARRLHGIHRGVLDSALRCVGETWDKAVFGGCAWHEKCARAAHRLARMPVAAISAFGGIAAGSIPARRRGMRGAVVDAAPQRSGADDQPTYPAHP